MIYVIVDATKPGTILPTSRATNLRAITRCPDPTGGAALGAGYLPPYTATGHPVPLPNGDTSRATIHSAHAGCAVCSTRPYCAVSVSDAGCAVSVSDAGCAAVSSDAGCAAVSSDAGCAVSVSDAGCAAVSSDAGCAAVSSSDTACTINSSDAVYIVQSYTVNTDKQPNLLCAPGGALELWRSELRTSRCRRIRYGYPDYLLR